MRNRLLLFALFFISFRSSYGQMVGGNMFLQGAYVEIGCCPNDAFGACTNPGGYHPHFGPALAEVYDYGHDGWTTGAPAYMGDYTYPGSPFEGWEIQVNGTRGQAYQNCGGTYNYSGGGSFTGAGHTSYSGVGGRRIGNYAATYTGGGSSLQIRQETRVDTLSSWVVVTTKFYNPSGSAVPGVYYWRSGDPDNDQTWPGGSFFTNNTIVHQNEDSRHLVQVSAVGRTGANSYMSLGTKDCRAVCCIYGAWGLTVGQDLAAVWSRTYGATYALGATYNGDVGIGLVYNIGTIPANDSAVISYAYMWGNNSFIDSAFPDPVLSINRTIIRTYPDTLDACLYPGVDSLPLDIIYGEDKSWTWGEWKWAPSTGLSATTGAHVFIHLSAVPGYMTYTVTGDDSTSHMRSCQRKSFVFTVHSCHLASDNDPCYGDTLKLKMEGDSLGATYVWYAPPGFTTPFSTSRTPYIYPALYTDSGLYHVVRTIAGVSDTDSTHVFIHRKPVITLTSNAPLCVDMHDTLKLAAFSDTTLAYYNWTGPAGYTATGTLPKRPDFIGGFGGLYTVYGATSYGCKDTSTIFVDTAVRPNPPILGGTIDYCYGSTYIPITALGANILWYPSFSSTTGTTTWPVVNTFAPGRYTFYATQTNPCLSAKDSITITVHPRINPNFDPSPIMLGCVTDTVHFTNLSTNADSYRWSFGDGTTDTAAGFGIGIKHGYTAHGVYSVKLTGHTEYCDRDTTIIVDTRHSVTANFTPSPDTICANASTTITDLSTSDRQGISSIPIAQYEWNFGDGGTDFTGTPPAHTYTVGGIYPIHLVVHDSIGCVDSITKNVYVIKITNHSFSDTMLCISQPLPMANKVEQYPDFTLSDYTYNWSPATYLDDSTLQNPFFNGVGAITYTFTATLNPYGCADTTTVTVNSVLGVRLANVTASATITLGTSIQLNADSEVFYRWVPNDGSLDNPNVNNPIATPEVTTMYTVYGYDVNGCLDSAYVTIYVDSTMLECMPAGFTPNGDGINDVFRPVGVKFQRMVDFRVYNRWGQQVFYSNNYKNGWDGTFNGEPQDLGTYFYTIVVARPGGDGQNITYKGQVTLIR